MLIILTLIVSLFVPSAFASDSVSVKQPESNKTVESFVVETTELSAEGLYERTGYKQVNLLLKPHLLQNINKNFLKLSD